ncbi:MAG TPA: ketopantoate reductase family protein, partial [Enterovirga sp.]
MRVLVVGAGAIGGYFGGRLAEAGRDVTFLVRPGRAAQLAKTGLVVRSPHGDIHLPDPVLVQAQDLAAPYDLVILSCKAYDLDNAIESFAPAVGPQTAILPLLNGMSHLDTLERRFGAKRVLGGQCVIGVTLDEDGRILHLNENHGLTYGERDGAISERMEGIACVFERAKFQAHSSEVILLEMWEKWVFLASLASGTCLMRAAVGDIVA